MDTSFSFLVYIIFFFMLALHIQASEVWGLTDSKATFVLWSCDAD